MSEFSVRVVRIGEIHKHENADKLSITHVDGGYPVVFSTGDYSPGDVAVYLPVDSIVPDTAEFAFLAPKDHPPGEPVPEKYRRIKAKKLRGVFSMGMLTPLPPGETFSIGEDAQQVMGVTKWEPGEEAKPSGNAKKAWYLGLPWWRKPLSRIFWGRLRWSIAKRLGFVKAKPGAIIEGPESIPVYTDIEALRKNRNVLEFGEEVVITEKLHGSNARFAWFAGEFWVGSHYTFKAPPAKPADADTFWGAAYDYDLLEQLSEYPGLVFYGEVYGSVQRGFGYDADKGTNSIRFFDILDTKTQKYLDFDVFEAVCQALGLETVPVLFRGPWQDDMRRLYSEGKSTLADHIREGFVVRPVVERYDHRVGRTILKHVGEQYLLAKAA